MKHYTSTIPLDLAKKLKEKGCEHPYAIPEAWEYGFIFDWLMEKGYLIVILRDEGRWTYWIGLTTDYDTYDDTCEIEGEDFDTWHEATTKAIEKALELI